MDDLITQGKSFEDRLKEMEGEFLKMLLEGIKSGEIKFQDARSIAKFVLSRIDLIKNQSQLVVFLHDLTEKWTDFGKLYELETVRLNEIDIQAKKLDDIKKQLLQFSQIK